MHTEKCWEDLASESASLASTLINNTVCDAECLHLSEFLPGWCLCAVVHDDNLGNHLPMGCKPILFYDSAFAGVAVLACELQICFSLGIVMFSCFENVL